MKKLFVIALVIFGFATLVLLQRAHAQNALKETLVNLENQSWEAWKKRDGNFFQNFLSDDHVEVGFGGATNKAAVVAFVGSPVCVINSYKLDHFELTVFDANTALLTYHAEQDTKCGGQSVPSPVWVSSLYVKRGGRWLNALYQQTQAAR
ncbi:MAG TPA: nuclear transport factor 2 family protein [Pyrinomonadaceae bacterium]|nr:nuclear transport factor 2 family protein [Pyrinomonadaceae bacterium]